uniref:Pyrin domain-containing protein n=1 Tax=Paramormyrops kingsleyae TaxID=1676925 RepID=A0A3B3TGD2_9TELE
MDDLVDDELKRFKFHLNTQVMDGFQPVPVSQLERADRIDTIKKMKNHYNTEGALQITHAILKKMEMNDLGENIGLVSELADNQNIQNSKNTRKNDIVPFLVICISKANY